jgi:hypothetical protein
MNPSLGSFGGLQWHNIHIKILNFKKLISRKTSLFVKHTVSRMYTNL